MKKLFKNITDMSPVHDYDHSSSSRKRKRSDYADGVMQQEVFPSQKARRSSHDLMPPPVVMPNPSQRLHRHQLAPQRPVQHRVEIYEDDNWKEPRHHPLQGDHYAEPQQSQRPSIEHQSLPFRPSPGRNLHTGGQQPQSLNQDLGVDRTSQYLPGPGLAAPQHPTEPLSQLSLHSPRRSNRYIRPATDHYAGQDDDQHLTRWEAVRHPEYDRSHTNTAQQSNDQCRQPLQQFSASYLNQRQPNPSRAGYLQATPPRQRQNPPAGASVTSPFFRQGAAIARLPPDQRSLSRSTAVREPPNHRRNAREAIPQYSLNGPPPFERLTGVVNNRQSYQSPEGSLFNRGSMIPQTPRNSQGLFRRPDLPAPAPTSYAPSRPASHAYQGRVSLPPTQRTGASLRSQEQQLSRITGVRGVNSTAMPPSKHMSGPVYDTSRQLLSAAGGRRSVRR